MNRKPKVVSAYGAIDKSSSVSKFSGSVILKHHDGTYHTETGEFFKSQFEWGNKWPDKNERAWR